jgi:hypothetical protein
MGYGAGRGGGRGRWPGNGPFSHLPPWQRPGRLYGRGACWRFWYDPGLGSASGYDARGPPAGGAPAPTKEQEQVFLREEATAMKERLSLIEKRLAELGK